MNKDFEVKFMGNEDEWPNWPVLPIVNRSSNKMPQAGILVANEGATIYYKNMFTLMAGPVMPQLDNVEKTTFLSFAELYDAGWRVD